MLDVNSAGRCGGFAVSPYSKALAGCISFLSLLLLSSCGGDSSPAPAGDFTLTATPASLSLVAGGGGKQVTGKAGPAPGFSGTVGAAVPGLPPRLTPPPAAAPLTHRPAPTPA